MTLMRMCALVPPLCRLAEDPQVRKALEALSGNPEADIAPLAQALGRHPEDARRVMSLLGSGEPPDTESIRRRFSREALAFFHLCGQCQPRELLCVLSRCTVPITAEALALLIGERRRRENQRQYALHLLWRMHGDTSLPPPAALQPSALARDVIQNTIRRLKEVSE